MVCFIKLNILASKLLESADSWPRICFLGTSSAVPTNFRNVSAYFLQFNENSCIFVDCGEGSYGQFFYHLFQ